MEENKKLTETALLKEAADASLPDFEAIRETCKAELQKERPKTKNARVWQALAAAAALAILAGVGLLLKNALPDGNLTVAPTEVSPSVPTEVSPQKEEPPQTDPEDLTAAADDTLTAEIERLSAPLFSATQGNHTPIPNDAPNLDNTPILNYEYVGNSPYPGLPADFAPEADVSACPDYHPAMYAISDANRRYPSGSPKAEIDDAYRAAALETLARYLQYLDKTTDDLTAVAALSEESGQLFSPFSVFEQLPTDSYVGCEYEMGGIEEDGTQPRSFFYAADLNGEAFVLARPGGITLYLTPGGKPGSLEKESDWKQTYFGSVSLTEKTAGENEYLSALFLLAGNTGKPCALLDEDWIGEGFASHTYRLYEKEETNGETMDRLLRASVRLSVSYNTGNNDEPRENYVTAVATVPTGDAWIDNEATAVFPFVSYETALALAENKNAADYGQSWPLAYCKIIYVPTWDFRYETPVYCFLFRPMNQAYWRQRFLRAIAPRGESLMENSKESRESYERWLGKINNYCFFREVQVPAYDLSSEYDGRIVFAGNR